MECLENIMVKDHIWPKPCRSEAPSFREFIEEEFSLADLLGNPRIMETLIKQYHNRYLEWLKEING